MSSSFEKALEWVKKADRNIQAAKELLRAGIYDYALFHAHRQLRNI